MTPSNFYAPELVAAPEVDTSPPDRPADFPPEIWAALPSSMQEDLADWLVAWERDRIESLWNLVQAVPPSLQRPTVKSIGVNALIIARLLRLDMGDCDLRWNALCRHYRTDRYSFYPQKDALFEALRERNSRVCHEVPIERLKPDKS